MQQAKRGKASKIRRGRDKVESPGLSGPKSIFRRKVRSRPPVVLTRKGHAAERTARERLGGISRSDFYEGLLHVCGETVTIQQILDVAARINKENE